MSFTEMKELAFIVLLTVLFAPVVIYSLGYILAKITYVAHNYKALKVKARRYETYKRLIKMGELHYENF